MFIILTCASAAGSIYFFNRVNSVYNVDNTYIFGDDPKYHFSLILNADDDVYWQKFKEGAFEAGKAYDSAIEFHSISEWGNSGEAAEYINIAYESRVDGIIVAAESNEGYSQALGNAAHTGINIVVGMTESLNSDRMAYVGTNFYEYGVQAAKLIQEAGGDKKSVNLAIILSSKNNEETDTLATTQNDVLLSGLNSVLKDDDSIHLVSTLYRSSDLLGAADLTKDILAQYPDIDIILCTNEKDTVAAARVLIERNLVGDVVIVGTDVTPEIEYYIDKGIVFGVLDRNGYEAGYNSVKMLYESMGSAFQSSYVDINVDIYTAVNIATYNG
jgi:ribose transport system substrate-binding protein